MQTQNLTNKPNDVVFTKSNLIKITKTKTDIYASWTRLIQNFTANLKNIFLTPPFFSKKNAITKVEGKENANPKPYQQAQ